MNKKIILAVVLALIIGAIVLLQKPAPAIPKPAIAQGNAPELAGIAGSINTDGITIGELVGKKVVLLDIWTYSCINCQRTLPYLTAWYAKYRNYGLEIIGVHSPEFAFEKDIENVLRAVRKFGITYPVVLDNDHATWNALKNRYWPAKYLIDIDGNIIWKHFGEGAYDEAERHIQKLLKQRAERLGLQNGIGTDMAEVIAETPSFTRINTPELYLGHDFTRGNFGNPQGLPPQQTVAYELPETFAKNNIYLSGDWFVDSDHVRLVSETGTVMLRYDAKNVNIVASAEPGSDVRVMVDGKHAKDVRVDEDDLYTVVAGTEYGERTLRMDATGAGFKLYTFTFG
jgi:thiol-disulfide isomerase/thioredoxin